MALDATHDKDEILEAYLNTVYFGGGAHGIRAAAEIFYGTTPERLDWGQSAMLAGLISNPSRFDPTRNPDAARERRDTAIDRLVESGYPRPYACALVAAGACTGILIPPSIAYIVIGLVLGISASTLFQAALIPGLLILTSILVTNIIVNRRMAYESGNQISFRGN